MIGIPMWIVFVWLVALTASLAYLWGRLNK